MAADIQASAVQTVNSRASDCIPANLEDALVKMEGKVDAEIKGQGITEAHTRRFADLCYVGMATELTVPIPDGQMTSESVEAAVGAFHAEHRRTYGYDYVGEQEVDIVNLRVRGTGPLQHIELAADVVREGEINDALIEEHEVYFGPRFGRQATRFYSRNKIATGKEFAGPAIVVEYDSTALVPPNGKAQVDDLGNLIVLLS